MIELPCENPDKYLPPHEGLDGYWWETNVLICVADIRSRFEGQGYFRRWLDELEAKGKNIFFPTVISARLDMILRKRGYIEAFVYDRDGFGCAVDGLAYLATTNKEKDVPGR